MLKRTIATLVAGTFAAIANISGATESPFPPSAEDIVYRLNPVQERYFQERMAALAQQDGSSDTARVSTDSPFPPSADEVVHRLNPAQERYFAEREASNPKLIRAYGLSFHEGQLD